MTVTTLEPLGLDDGTVLEPGSVVELIGQDPTAPPGFNILRTGDGREARCVRFNAYEPA